MSWQVAIAYWPDKNREGLLHITDSSTDNWLNVALKGLPQARVAVFGDFCLDAYWLIDPAIDETSVETGLSVRHVRSQNYSLGGAANVAANLAALGIGEIRAIGLIGDDLYGGLMQRMLRDLGVEISDLSTCQGDWQTVVFGKPCIGDDEQNRLDFGSFNALSPVTIDVMAKALDRVAEHVDVVILNQQVPAGVSTPEMIERINAVIARHPHCTFLVDSRHRPALYQGAIVKINAHEATAFAGHPSSRDERVTAEQAHHDAEAIHSKTHQSVFVTRGENGIVLFDGNSIQEVPGIQVIERIDPVGAGDTTVATLAAVLGSCGTPLTAAKLANIAASVIVRKIRTTGTACPDEIRAIGPDPDYIYLPELADDPRRASYIAGSEIEGVRDLPSGLNIRHAIFDHDGTISTLRQGWEKIMEPVMLRAILGSHYEDADEVLYHKVVDTLQRFIDKTTGIQTLVQMQGLVELVRQFGCVPADNMLDIHGYKAIYNEALLEMVRGRVEKLSRSELAPEDFQIKNARPFLETLHKHGVRLYLASGTDEADVVSEAEALGYAHLFEGGIFGATGDIKVEAKRIVLERIIRENNLSGAEFVTLGDGPVEMRECRKRGGIAVGIASDEVQRFGLDPAKRTRLIRAGADLVVPDFSQLDTLLDVLGVQRHGESISEQTSD